jgi:DNA replication protein DnaC
MANLGKKVGRVCLDCGDEFEATNLGPATANYCRKCAAARSERQEAAERESRRQAEEQRRLELLRLANLPPKWRDVTFDNSDPQLQPKAFKFAKKYAENFTTESPSVIFYSNINGTGKSHLAACILNYVMKEKRIPVRWEKARDVMLQLRRTFSDLEVSEASVIDRISFVKLLVLDDVGRDPASQWIHTTYWQLLDRRLEWNLPVVITANLLIDGGPNDLTLGERIGEGAVSRLRSLCRGYFIDLTDVGDLRFNEGQ